MSWRKLMETGSLAGGNSFPPRRPLDTPTLDAEGNLYGTVCLGGDEDGEVFKLTPTGSR